MDDGECGKEEKHCSNPTKGVSYIKTVALTFFHFSGSQDWVFAQDLEKRVGGEMRWYMKHLCEEESQTVRQHF